jgi:hypothetical protein
MEGEPTTGRGTFKEWKRDFAPLFEIGPQITEQEKLVMTQSVLPADLGSFFHRPVS